MTAQVSTASSRVAAAFSRTCEAFFPVLAFLVVSTERGRLEFLPTDVAEEGFKGEFFLGFLSFKYRKRVWKLRY